MTDPDEQTEEDRLSPEDYAQRFLAPHRSALDLAVRAMFRGRGWVTPHRDSGGLGEGWEYPGSFGSREINPIDELFRLGLEPLEVGVTAGPEPTVHAHACGVHDGCPQHRSAEHRLPFDSPELPALLSDLEQHAAAIDADAVAGCLAFGPCGREGRERPW
uniref:hypothetical protein n=1 Tax=Amycolatopsis sp. CA-096443 TaxID=3239919 RepID=UPI003F490633